MEKKHINPDSKSLRIVLICMCAILAVMMYIKNRHQNQYKEIAKLPFYNISVSNVEDGTYHGKTYTSFQHIQLDVSIKDHKITKIDIIENEGSYGQKVAPIIDEMILQNQSVVTAIKGDEIASILFIICVDDALKNGDPTFVAPVTNDSSNIIDTKSGLMPKIN